MTKMLLNWLDKIKAKVGTKTYNVFFALFAVACTTLISGIGPAKILPILALFVAALNNVALFLLIIFTLQYFQGGANSNIHKAIFEDGNIAAAIFQGLIYLGIAILIGGAIM